MDIKEVREEKIRIEFKIKELVNQFERKTDTNVNEIIMSNKIVDLGRDNKSIKLQVEIN